MLKSDCYEASKPTYKLLEDVHLGIDDTNLDCSISGHSQAFVCGAYCYYHYKCDEVNDCGWGCGYRTLQTLCSWIEAQNSVSPELDNVASVGAPSILSIQKALVVMEDKPELFIGSKQWLGSVEISYCLDYFYNVSSKIIHISNGAEIHKYIDALIEHFRHFGSPVMMGGSTDASSKGIFGVRRDKDNDFSLLVVDPHFAGVAENTEKLINSCWVSWKNQSDFIESSFYNLCLPQYKCNVL